jgi:hypothetical protein
MGSAEREECEDCLQLAEEKKELPWLFILMA